ncbi:anthranilate phosphoribosyltransferase [Halanaerobium saccharolyticum]|uniref:Anthranilate phosphoribosyltransferase n=1 Tax=Halanaerobium saccharolyticum TaxID=43595 RepID=A0A4R7Z908_9FIRM|nr:anthranilate phosphoribosyltransferase [Halanaerobium saccharolyticum]RAK11896.1 anthranilate phosphoribosyltransferase [Halanaerobium saccharolyticum]TDW07737.1 anthranilate phosphoribosyltransferase [Halanaerobium saccharolyticum]TDX64658.1 anthranilate phosphoribosyltransferase [Halanaerobium saccharolyticum]
MFNKHLDKVVSGKDLTLAEMEEAMSMVMEGKTTDSQLAGFLVGLRMKGETIDEITGAASVMRNKAAEVKTEARNLIDSCGTGGDEKGTFNISTTTALVMAAGGLNVAKHGNRSVSSKSGSADLLEALGVKIDLSPEAAGKCLDQIGISFLFAPHFHQAMKYAIGPRKELGLRTIFNILGPLTNPAKADYQVLGVYKEELVMPLAYVLKNLGLKSAMVVHGAGGVDELSLVGENKTAYLKDGEVKEYNFSAEDAGLESAPLESILGGVPEENKQITLDILKGKKGPKRDVILLNSAAAFLVENRVDSLQEGVKMAAELIDSGKAMQKLEELIQCSNSSDNSSRAVS